MVFLSMTAPQAHAGVVNYQNVKKAVSAVVGAAVGGSVGVAVGAAVSTATAPSGPISVVAGAGAGAGAATATGGYAATLTYQAMSHPVAAGQVAVAASNPGIAIANSIEHPQTVVSAVKNVYNGLFN